MNNPKVIKGNLQFQNEKDAIDWIIEWKDMSHPQAFLKSSIECGYINIVE